MQVGIVERRHRHEIAHQLERLVRDQRLVGRVRVRHHQQRVAVGRRLRDRIGADDRAGAGPVLDDEGLLELFGEMLRDDARVDVGRTAGAERHDHAHLPRRIVLRLGRTERSEREQREGDNAQQCHELPPRPSCGALIDGRPRRFNAQLVAGTAGQKNGPLQGGQIHAHLMKISSAIGSARRACRPASSRAPSRSGSRRRALRGRASHDDAAVMTVAVAADTHADARAFDVDALRRELGRLRPRSSPAATGAAIMQAAAMREFSHCFSSS